MKEAADKTDTHRALTDAEQRVTELETKANARREAVAAAQARHAKLTADRARAVIAGADGDRTAQASATKLREALVSALVEIDDARAILEATERDLLQARALVVRQSRAVAVGRLSASRLEREKRAVELDTLLTQLGSAVSAYMAAAEVHLREVHATTGLQLQDDPARVVVKLVNASLIGSIRATILPPEARQWLHLNDGQKVSLREYEESRQFQGYEARTLADISAQEDAPAPSAVA